MPNHSYPWTTELKGRRITLRLMQPEETPALLELARGLPEDDLLFLSIDLTKPEAAEAWASGIRGDRIVTILAECDGVVLGHGSLSHNDQIGRAHV